MTDAQYVLCRWKRRWWPAKVLSRTETPTKNKRKKDFFLDVQILSLDEKIQVRSSGVQSLSKSQIEDIASLLASQNEAPAPALEELAYRRSLRVALDVLNEAAASSPDGAAGGGRAAPAPSPQPADLALGLLPDGALGRSPPGRRGRAVHSLLSASPSEKEPGVPGCPLTSLEAGRLGSRGRGRSQTLRRTPAPSPSSPHSGSSPEASKENESKRAGSPCPGFTLWGRGDNTLSEVREPWVTSGGAPALSAWRQKTSESCQETPAHWPNCPDPREVPAKRLRLEEPEPAGCVAPHSARHASEPHPPEPEKAEEGNKPATAVPPFLQEAPRGSFPSSVFFKGLLKEVALFELAAGALGHQSSEGSVELSPLDSVLEEDEEEEEPPRILLYHEPRSFEVGMLVWLKYQKYPFWPAVVKSLRRRDKKASVLFIEGNMNPKGRGITVSLRRLKHFDCKEKQVLLHEAKQDFEQAVGWCVALITDYRVRLGCGSFTGSFLEYYAADISYPVRKSIQQDVLGATFPQLSGVDPEEPEAASPQPHSPPCRKVLPDRSRAARDRANRKLVEYIVKARGAESHLHAILRSQKPSRWLKTFLSSSQYMTCVETYLEDEEQLDLVVKYLQGVYQDTGSTALTRLHGDPIRFILDVLLPEAIICAIAAVDEVDYKTAEEKYVRGPSLSYREKEIFDKQLLEERSRRRR
ncbi:PREDICTED: PWWP domain-containing protein MUM1-like [Elephantulus edwardii]|uniref:PWWP domain-containing protein MUM1-like n=1 Tax=Elephantulus edwardii TaxID=28737 RepID=UPI0003F0A4B7|nr:PREDICTED: PWWP domain-containing protein MUM1-like [Elephantulus edwardii]